MVNIPQNRHEKAPKLAVAPKEDKQIWTIRNTILAALTAVAAFNGADKANAGDCDYCIYGSRIDTERSKKIDDIVNARLDQFSGNKQQYWNYVLDIKPSEGSQAGSIVFPSRQLEGDTRNDREQAAIFIKSRKEGFAYSKEYMQGFAEMLYEHILSNGVSVPVFDLNLEGFYDTQAENMVQALQHVLDSFDELDKKYGLEGRKSPRFVLEPQIRLEMAKSLFIAHQFAERKGRNEDAERFLRQGQPLLERNITAKTQYVPFAQEISNVANEEEWKQWDEKDAAKPGFHPEQNKMRRAIEDKYGIFNRETGAQYLSDDTDRRTQLLLAAYNAESPEAFAKNIPGKLLYSFIVNEIRTDARLAGIYKNMAQKKGVQSLEWNDIFYSFGSVGYVKMAEFLSDSHADKLAGILYEQAGKLEVEERKKGINVLTDIQLAQSFAVPIAVRGENSVEFEYSFPNAPDRKDSREFFIQEDGTIGRRDHDFFDGKKYPTTIVSANYGVMSLSAASRIEVAYSMKDLEWTDNLKVVNDRGEARKLWNQQEGVQVLLASL